MERLAEKKVLNEMGNKPLQSFTSLRQNCPAGEKYSHKRFFVLNTLLFSYLTLLAIFGKEDDNKSTLNPFRVAEEVRVD